MLIDTGNANKTRTNLIIRKQIKGDYKNFLD